MEDQGDEGVYRVDLPENDFRRLRFLLGPDCFAISSDEPDFPATDLVPADAWHTIMDLPTDVAIRGTSHNGSDIVRLYNLHRLWQACVPLTPDPMPLSFEGYVLATEELEALVFIGLHGFYRQAFGCLRNVLEDVAVGTLFTLTDDERRLKRWRSGARRPTFDLARKELAATLSVGAFEQSIAPASIFGNAPSAWSNRLYERLCGYSHSRPGFNNADFWESNGPVHRPAAFQRLIAETAEVVAICVVMLKLSWPAFQLPRPARSLYSQPGPAWADVGPAVLANLFPSPPA